jgi:hypothetical protein
VGEINSGFRGQLSRIPAPRTPPPPQLLDLVEWRGEEGRSIRRWRFYFLFSW